MARARAATLVALVAVLLLPTSVMAAKADRFTVTSTQFWCAELQSEGGTAQVSAWLSDGGETFADLVFWAPGASGMTWAGWSNSTLMSSDGSSIEITFGIYGFNEGDVDDPSDLVFVGDGTLTATLTASGNAETFRVNDQYGNGHQRVTGAIQALDVSGNLDLPTGISFDVSGCDAFRSTERWFNNNATHAVSHAREFGLSCGWQTEDGFVALFAMNKDSATFADLWVETGDSYLYGSGDATLSRAGFEGTFELRSVWDQESDAVGSASASAVLTSLDRVSQSEEFGDGRFTAKGLVLGVSGSLTVETGSGAISLDMNAEACQASDVRYSRLPSQPERAEPVENDSPDVAVPLKLGDKLIVSTAGTDESPEAPCLLEDSEGGTYEGPMTHTAWWRIEGTGSPITVDTAGSLFDTMVAVYLVEDGAVGAQVGCVDDVDEGLEARITFDSAAAASYLVQTGGYGGQSGDLSLAIYE